MRFDSRLHFPPVAVLALFAALAFLNQDLCVSLAQEDDWVEWLTFGFFLAAAALYAKKSVRLGLREGWFISGMALFCFLVAGEEISWGERLLGYVPSEIFLKRNFQQESNLHNFIQPFLNPKWLLVAALLGWGVLLPSLRLHAWTRKRLEDWRIAAPAWDPVPWSMICAGIVLLYPLDFTGEYMELMAATIFFSDSWKEDDGRWWMRLLLPAAFAGGGLLLMTVQAQVGRGWKTACAEAETAALAKAIEAGGASGRHQDFESVHKRAYGALRKRYFSKDLPASLEGVLCADKSSNSIRRRYLVDPWAQPYWVRFREGESGDYRAAFYSFGPNRRRDSKEGRFEGTDDIGTWSGPIPEAEDGEGGEGEDGDDGGGLVMQ